ncbi:MAG: xylulokinase [Thermoflexales bacterium]|nr:xylulokinase [Thermoflexales bacterium]
MPFVLAHDLGTTGNKANLFDAEGRLVASHLEPYPVAYPHAGWAEQDPDDWWRAVCRSTQALLTHTGISPSMIAAVTFSGQMMGVVALSEAGVPLRPAIIWADQRATEEATLIAERCGVEAVYQRTGHRVSPAYIAAKLLWLKRNQPELYAQTRCFLTAKDYAAFKLTGALVTDYSDASGTNLFDLHTRTWCADFIEHLELDPARLPALHASTDVIGEVTPDAAKATGLQAGTPVVIGGGDGACAAVGAGAVDGDEAYCVLGTSAWISFTSPTPLIDPQQRTFTFHALQADRYVPMGTMQSAGGARDWLVRTIGEVSEEAIAATPPGCNGLLFLPYLIGERSPWWNPHARAAFLGLTMSHDAAAMHRALLEGVAFNLRLIFEALCAQVPLRALRLIGGGARSPVWRRILADVLGVPLHIPTLLAEATSWGAAVAGGVAVGLYPDWSVARAQTRVVEIVEPSPQQTARYDEIFARFQQAYHATVPLHAPAA